MVRPGVAAGRRTLAAHLACHVDNRPPKSRHTDGSGSSDVYLPGPCTGR
jgi:hypothetical protein